jgi:phage anti-repressor protein
MRKTTEKSPAHGFTIEQPISIIPNGDIFMVDARDLHRRLGVTSRFNDWIRNRIKEYGLAQGTDYAPLTKNLVNGGKQTDYYLSIDTAKELAMVERTAEGRKIRMYFIEIENEYRNKRLYGQRLNLTEIKRKVLTAKVNGRLIIEASKARSLMGFNSKSSLSYWRSKFPGLIIKYNGILMCAEEIIELWLLRSTLKDKSKFADMISESKPILPANFNQLNLSL